jgi:site-specific recombinase XerD
VGIVTVFADLLQGFFADKLINERQASAHTIASYRDTMSLLLHYMSDVHGHHPDELTFAVCNAEAIGGFLAYLETERGNSTSTRNTRLAAIRSFYRYASYRDPQDQALINQVLSIGPKRGTRHVVAYLTDPEIQALLDAPDQSCWHGQRDHALLHTAIYTGLRVSELTGLLVSDVHLERTGAYVQCVGKGRKTRRTPLARPTRHVLAQWVQTNSLRPDQILFGTIYAHRLSRDAVAKIIRHHQATAIKACPKLEGKTLTPHVLRHTCAMQLLQAGIDINVIAMWLGHQSTETTQIYLHADMRAKEKALAQLTIDGRQGPGRYHPDGELLQFLAGL